MVREICKMEGRLLVYDPTCNTFTLEIKNVKNLKLMLEKIIDDYMIFNCDQC